MTLINIIALITFIIIIVALAAVAEEKKKLDQSFHEKLSVLEAELSFLKLYKNRHKENISRLEEKKAALDLEIAKLEGKKFEFNSELAKWKEQRQLFEKVTRGKIRKKKIRGKKRRSRA